MLWTILEDYEVQGQLLDIVRALYLKCESAIRTKHGITDWFNITTGVRQGCGLSPLLYIINMDKISSDVNSNQ
jgi:hypothetical protein